LSAANTGLARNIIATALARAAPVSLRAFMGILLFDIRKWIFLNLG